MLATAKAKAEAKGAGRGRRVGGVDDEDVEEPQEDDGRQQEEGGSVWDEDAMPMCTVNLAFVSTTRCVCVCHDVAKAVCPVKKTMYKIF